MTTTLRETTNSVNYSQFSMVQFFVNILKYLKYEFEFRIYLGLTCRDELPIVTAFSNFLKWTCLVCQLTLLWTHTKVLVLTDSVRG